MFHLICAAIYFIAIAFQNHHWLPEMNVLNVKPVVEMFTKFFYSVNQQIRKIFNPNLKKKAILRMNRKSLYRNHAVSFFYETSFYVCAGFEVALATSILLRLLRISTNRVRSWIMSWMLNHFVDYFISSILDANRYWWTNNLGGLCWWAWKTNRSLGSAFEATSRPLFVIISVPL